MTLERPGTPTFLVTGRNGQVGFALCRSLAALGRVVAFDRAACNMLQPDAIRRAVRACKPDVIVNAAAYTAVDAAETDPDTAFAVNANAVSVLAEEARALGSLLVHYSTDHVFDGRKTAPYVETDPANPQSVYGKSKLAGEQAIAEVGGAALILRTCWVAGAHGGNFVRAILAAARTQQVVRVVDDQYGSPTSATLVANVTARLIETCGLAGGGDSSGLYHLAAKGGISRYAYARAIVDHALKRGIALRMECLEPVSSAQWQSAARRPANGALNCSKLQQAFGVLVPDWEDDIGHVLDHIFAEANHA